MSELPYRHLTNLASPVDDVDGVFLNVLADYRIGPPISNPRLNQRPVPDMVRDGIFGVYTTTEAMSNSEVRRITAWTDGDKMLGTTVLGEPAGD